MWGIDRIPYDAKDPDRVQRWIDWLDSPYWDLRAKRRDTPANVDAQLAMFGDAMSD